MILARITEALRAQNWFAVAIEFVIVIAGVVIGFQITAWNGERDDRRREAAYVLEIREDVRTELAEIRQSLESARMRIASVNAILEAALGEEPRWTVYDAPGMPAMEPVVLPEGIGDDALILSAAYMRTIDPVHGAWDMMMSTGDVSVMTDADLVRQIQSYRARLTSVVDLEQFIRTFMPGIDAERRAAGLGLGQTMPLDQLSELIRTRPELAAGLRTTRNFAFVQVDDLQSLEAEALSLVDSLQVRAGDAP
ncbi:hypothetical protein [Maricaulis sp.]|uniref:hypothetical protein n=1 Tax=Maricaulis sp. TaxID=1486257 RepID=UPI0025C70D28|nr:hypothetical protein [Maricaulis sp.]